MRILIVGNDVVSSRMAGPGIRCFELGRQLTRAGHQVTVTGIGAAQVDGGALVIAPTYDPREMERVAAAHDAILLEGFALARYPRLRNLDVPLIVDLYDPFPLSILEQEAQRPASVQRVQAEGVREALSDLLEAGDFFLCASERQRDLWIGALIQAGRINPDTWRDDNSLRRLIDVVPFGVSEDVAPLRSPESRGELWSTVGTDDLVLVWGGGIYNWFDPLTLVRAVGLVARSLASVKLVFMSTTHPNPGLPPRMWMPARTKALSDSLGLTGRQIIFHDQWVRYDDRGRWLAASDCGVSTHFDHAETRYAYRTRIVDYLWAGLPIICTDGDVVADTVRERGLGWVVAPEDEQGLARAVMELAAGGANLETMRANVLRVAAQMTWPLVVKPLVAYCEAPRRAADSGRAPRARGAGRAGVAHRASTASQLVQAGLGSLTSEGAAATWRKSHQWWSRRRHR